MPGPAKCGMSQPATVTEGKDPGLRRVSGETHEDVGGEIVRGAPDLLPPPASQLDL